MATVIEADPMMLDGTIGASNRPGVTATSVTCNAPQGSPFTTRADPSGWSAARAGPAAV